MGNLSWQFLPAGTMCKLAPRNPGTCGKNIGRKQITLALAADKTEYIKKVTAPWTDLSFKVLPGWHIFLSTWAPFKRKTIKIHFEINLLKIKWLASCHQRLLAQLINGSVSPVNFLAIFSPLALIPLLLTSNIIVMYYFWDEADAKLKWNGTSFKRRKSHYNAASRDSWKGEAETRFVSQVWLR